MTGLSSNYVYIVGRLLERGERRLVAAVEAGYLPISVALDICESDEQGVQAALHKAYEANLLRGRSPIAERRLVALRKRYGNADNLTQIADNKAYTPPAQPIQA